MGKIRDRKVKKPHRVQFRIKEHEKIIIQRLADNTGKTITELISDYLIKTI